MLIINLNNNIDLNYGQNPQGWPCANLHLNSAKTTWITNIYLDYSKWRIYSFIDTTDVSSLGDNMRYLFVFITIIISIKTTWADSVENCPKHYGAKIVSLQGKLFVDRDIKGQWQPIQLGGIVCQGSRLRVDPYSRASIMLPNGIGMRLAPGTEIVLHGIESNETTLLDILKGFVHFLSRTPKRLNVNTPFVNAQPIGTEFAMRVDDSAAALWVYEGNVKFSNAQGSLQLSPGQAAQARQGQAPQAKIDIKPQDAVVWALYYPPLLPYPDATTVIDNDLRTAIRDFRLGHVDVALARLDALPQARQTPYYLKVRGAMRLTVGQDQLALQDSRALLANNPNDAEALALQSVLALTQNRKDEGPALANQAIAANPQSSTAYSALSYAEQGRFELDNALAAAEQAVKLAPHDAMVWARKAELELAQGLTSESKATAERALALDANLERTQTVTGFAYLLSMDTDEALQAFDKAIQLDSTSPLARLGLGLAKIRNGDLAEGREDLEIAALLDPNNSLIRSYLGKAYYEEKRSSLAEDQFNLAKQRDPKDPTPYFYDAIQKQTTNRPVEALHDMQKAIELNDNRGIYRSKLMIDEDAATRTANIARIYNDLGFNRLALKEAWSSLAFDNENHSAHRFLADSYVGQARFRTARASELLQAQLLQPINVIPVQPQLTSENIGILNNTGPSSLSTNEYDRLFTADGVHLLLNGAIGSRNTKTDNTVISGVYKKLSMSLGQFHYQTDGFRLNDSYKQDIYNAFAQYAIAPDLDIQVELKSEDLKSGDVPLRLNGFHREQFSKSIEHDSIRFGLHKEIDNQQDFIFTSIYSTLKDIESNHKNGIGILDPLFPIPIPFKQFNLDEVTTKGTQSEAQYSYHPGNFKIITGFGYLNLDKHLRSLEEQRIFDFIKNDYGPPFTTPKKGDTIIEYINGYLYAQSNLKNNFNTTIGISVDSYDDGSIKRNQINPKLGLNWKLSDQLTLRGAVFKTLKRPLATAQTIEPTQIAGFNQFYDSENGSSAWQQGVGIDYNPLRNVYLGGQVTFRQTKFPLIFSGLPTFLHRNESSHLAYLYWTPNDYLSLATEYRFDEFRRDHFDGAGDLIDPKSVTTHQVPVSFNFYHRNGIFSRITATYVNQQVTTVEDSGSPSNRNEDFWTFDAVIGYRLPKKYGSLNMEVRNLFDNDFNYQSTFDASGPQLSNFIPERQVFFKINLTY
jgi:Flp pilus assembly protein TadD